MAVDGVEEEHLVGGDDAADLLDVDDDGALPAEDRRRVDKERVKEVEVMGGSSQQRIMVALSTSTQIKLRVPPPRFLRLGTSRMLGKRRLPAQGTPEGGTEGRAGKEAEAACDG